MNKSIRYRPEIDGLRTIAVLSVIVFHAKFSLNENEIWLPGGFLGVDIFFVISGYLITSIILRELDAGKFSFLEFYKRRARRILPALFLVILFTIPLSWFFLLPKEMVEYGYSLISSLLFYSNIQFWSENSYWATAGELKPLLHTWSLAVEEQYYFFIPILLVILQKFWKQGTLFISLLALLCSFVLAIIYTPHDPNSTFYFLPFRLWELMTGGVLACFELRFGRNTLNCISRLFVAAGLVGLILSVVFIDEQYLHPHWVTIIPILSTASIIWFAKSDDFTTKILASRPFVAIGLISYSLYLWHWPIFAFARASEIDLNVLIKIGLILLTFLMATLSYFLVEKRFRKKSFNLSISSLAKPLIIPTSIIIFGIYALQTNGFNSRLSDLYKLYNGAEPINRLLQKATWVYVDSSNNSFSSSNNTKVLIMGDSHAKDLYNVFYLNQNLFENHEFFRSAFSISPRDNSPCSVNVTRNLDEFLSSEEFKKANYLIISDFIKENRHVECLDKFLSTISDSDKTVYIFSSQKFNDPSVFEFEQSTKNIIANTTHNITVFRDKNYLLDLYFERNPLSSLNISDLSFFSNGEITPQNANHLQYKLIDENIIKLNSEIEKLSVKYKHKYVNKYNYLCDSIKKTCPVFTDDGHKIYYDRMHFTVKGAEFMGKKIYSLGIFP